jgi:periplasmic copper chaperone A
MMNRMKLAAFAVLVSGATIAQAQAPVTMTGAWVREPVPGRPTTAAYVVLENPGATDLTIVSAATDAAGKVELHEMIRSGDMMRMSPVKSVIVPARGKVELKPGGLHIMLFELKKPLKEGDSVELTFTTDKGATMKTTAAVKKGMMMQ